MPKLPNITPDIIKSYQDEISKTSSPSTIKRKTISMNKFFDWAEKQGHLENNPLKPVAPAAPVVSENPYIIVKQTNYKKIGFRTFAVLGITTGMVVLIILLLRTIPSAIQFIKTPAQEITNSNTPRIVNIPQKSASPLASSAPVITANNAGIGSWNLYASLKLTDGSGNALVGPQTISFKVYNSEQGGSPLYTSADKSVTSDANGSALISLDGVPNDLFFKNDKLYLEPVIASTPSLARIPVSTANVSANLDGHFPSENATAGTIPVINANGSLVLAGQSPAIKSTAGNFLFEGQALTIKTTDGSDGNIEINPDGKGYTHFLFEGNKGNFLNAQAPNLTNGSLYYGIVANNATGYDLVRLQNGSGKPVTRFSVDALGDTFMTGNETVKGNLSVNGIANSAGYSQSSGNFTINQNVGDQASITKTGSALSDVLTLTLDERGKPASPNSDYSTLVLNRFDGNGAGAALKVANGNAIFNGQVQLGRYASTPNGIGQGSLVYNTTDNQVYVFNGTSWTSLGSGSGIAFNNILSGTNTGATMVVGNGASLGFSGTGTIDASSLNGNASSAFLRSNTSSNYTSGTLTTNFGTTLDVRGNLLLDGSAGTAGQIAASAGTGTPTWNNITSLLTAGTDTSITGTTNATINNTSTLNSVTGRGATTSNTITVGNLIDSGLTASSLVFTDLSKQLTSTGTVPVNQGGTGFSSYTVGDLLYADTASSLAKLNDVATGNVLISGGAGVAPSWGKVALGTHTTGNYVSTIAGTANQITASASTGNVTLSIPSDFRVPGTIQLNGITYTFPAVQSSNFILATDGSGTLSWADPSVVSAGSNYWDLTNGLLYPKNSSTDFLLGGISTASAKFAFINTLSGTPTATISGTTANVATYLTGNGNLAVTNSANLTLGGATTGNVVTNSPLVANSAVTINSTANTQNILPLANATYDLGSNTFKWNNIYGVNVYQNGNLVCDSSGTNCPAGYWNQANGALFNNNNTVDVLFGGSSTASAKFAFTGVNSGTPTASVSGTYLTSNGNLATTNMNHLTLGGSTTGQVDVNNNLNLTTGNSYLINGANVLNSTTLGSGVTNSSLTQVGALTSGSIASGFGSILTTNGITGGTLTSTGTTTFGGLTYTWPGTQTNNYVLTTDGAGTLTWTDPSAAVSAAIYWTQANGVLNPKNNSVDVLIGANSTSSAKFAFKNVLTGTPTATISGSTANVATYIDGDGNISTTNAHGLTLGSSSTGSVTLNSRGTNTVVANGTQTTLAGVLNLNNSNIIAGVPNFTEFNKGVSVGGGTTYYFDNSGNLNANNITVNGNVASNLVPSTNNTFDLGSASNKWANAYAIAFNQNGNTVCDSSDNCLVNGPWVQGAGILNPKNNSVDVLIGGNSTNSAKFAFTGVNSGTPTASISGTYLTSTGNLATTNMQHLTLGGSTTGQVDVGNNLNLATGKALLINGVNTLNATTLGNGVINSSLTSVGTLNSLAVAGTTTFGGLTYTWPASQSTNYVLTTDGSGTLSWTDPAAAVASTIYWTQANGVLNPKNSSVDVLIGGNSTGSAKFAFTGVNSGTPTASVSGTYLTSAGNLATTNMNHLSLGGNSTGQVDVNNDLNLASGKSLLINGANTLNATTLGNAVVNSSLTSVGALSSGSIASGFGTISTSNSINGSTLGTNNVTRIDNSGNLTNIGTTQINSLTYTWPSSQSLNSVLTSNGTGTLTWTDPNSLVASSNYWNQALGTIFTKNNTEDLLVGSSSTSSAKFAFVNVLTGTPTATIAGSTANVATYLDGNGNLATTNMNHLTLGGSSTGQVDINNNVNLASGKAVLINGVNTLNSTTLGSSVVNSSLTSVGTLGSLAVSGTTTFGGLTYTWPASQTTNYILQTDGSGTLSWADPNTIAASTIYWNQANGALFTKNNTVDVLFGASSTASAKFAFTGMISGTPTASVSGTYLTADGSLATTKMQHLTLGGSTTGQVDVNNNLNLATGKAVLINGVNTLNSTTLGSTVTNSSLTQVGALNSGSIASGFGSILTTNGITGGTLTSTGTTTFGGLTYTWPVAQTTNYILQTDGSGTLSWVDPSTVAASTIYWSQANGALFPKNNSVDVLIGSNSTSSAKFAFTGVNSGTPTASISGTYLTSTGILSNTSMNALTLGSSTTGSVTLNSRGNNALIANGLNLTAGGSFLLPNGNLLTGLPNFVQFDNGISIGAGTTYYFDSAGNLNGNAGTFAGNVAVNGGSLTTSSTGTANLFNANATTLHIGGAATAVTLGASNVALTLGGNSTIYGGSNASGTLTLSSTSNATKGNIQFFTSSNTIDSSGNLTLAGNATVNGNTTLGDATSDTVTFNGRVNSNVLPSVTATDDLGSVALAWNNIYGTSIYQNGNLVCDSTGSNCPVQFNLWNQTNGALYNNNNTVDVLFGGSSTSSAKFAFTGVNSGTPTASISGTYLTSTGNLATTKNQHLTLGGSTTGQVDVSNDLNLATGKSLLINGVNTLNATTLGSNVVNSSLTQVGALASGSIASGFGSILTTNGITGGTLTSTGTIALPNSNTLTGVSNYVQFNNGVSVGAATAFHFDTNGNIISNDLNVNGNTTLGDATSDTVTFNGRVNSNVLPSVTATDDLGSAALKWNNIYAVAFSQNGNTVCDSSNNCAGSLNYWSQANGALYNNNNTVDVLIGGSSTSSAKFAFTGVNSGTPTASVSGTYLTSTGNLATTNMNHLTLGGSTTGQVDVNNNLNLASGNAYLINNTSVLNGTTLGSGVVNSSLTSVGTLTSGSIASGFGSILTTNGITGGTLTSTGTTTFGGLTYTWPVSQTTNYVLTTDGAGTLTWADPNATNYWNQALGAVFTKNNTEDLLVGSNSTSSAKFAFTGVNSGTPTASIAGTTTNVNTFLTGNGNLAVTNMAHLTLGGSTTGQVDVNNDLNLAAGKALLINGVNTLNATTLGGNVVNSSLTQVGALASGSIASGFGTISTANNINGSSLSTSSVVRIDSSGNITSNDLTVNGNTTLGSATSKTITVTGRVNSNVLPSVTATDDLGSAALKWNNVYAVAFSQNGNTVCDSSGNCPGATNYWNQANGALYSNNNTVDVLIGASSTSSAKFAFTGVNSGTPTASIAGTTANVATYLDGNGNLATTNMNHLTLGGSTTGQVDVSNNLNLATGKALLVNGVNTLNATTLGGNVVNSSLTQVGALASGSIASGFGTISTSNNINGSSLSTSSVVRIDSSGNITSNDLTVNGNTTLGSTTGNTISYTGRINTNVLPSVTATDDLGSASLKWNNIYAVAFNQNGNTVCDSSGNCPGSVNYWQLNNKVVSPANTTYDLAVGGTATGSAFQVFGIENATGDIAKVNSTVITSGNVIEATSSAITSGNIIKLGEAGGQNFTGNGILLDFDNTGGGSFTGNFVRFDNATSTKFTVDSTGNISAAGTTGLTLSGTGAGLTFSGSNAHAIAVSNAATNLTIDAGTTGAVQIGGTSTGGVAIAGSGTGDVTIAGGSASTGCTIVNATGALSCSGDIATTATSGTQGWWQQNNNIVSPVNSTYDLAVGGTATGSAFQVFGIENAAGNIAKINSTAINTGNIINATSSAITSGSIVKLGEAGGQNFTGKGIWMDFDNTGGGSFTGNFVQFDNATATKFSVDSSGNVTTAGNIAVNGGGITSTGDLTITPAGGQLILADTDTLNVGGATNVGYNAFANSADTPASSAITTDNDLFIGGDLETKGGLYLTGKNIYNVVGGVSTGSIALAIDPSLINNYNVLGNGAWLVQNGSNNGIAALMIDQTKGGDIFSASQSGTPKLTLKQDTSASTDQLLLTSTGITSGDVIHATSSAITSGSMLHLGEAGAQNFTGKGIWLDFDNTGGGSFTGNFVQFDKAGATQFTVDASGNITGAGTTGLTLSGTGAGFSFSGANAHAISNSTAATNLTIDAGTTGVVQIAGTSTGGVAIAGSGTGDVTIAGGSGSTGCTITNSTGDLTCTGTVTANGAALTNYWQLNNKIISPANSTFDLAVGGTATGSAFQVFGAPVATADLAKLTSSVITSGNVFEATASGITSGNLIKLGQGGNTNFTGNGITMDFDNTGGGSFTGKFLSLNNNSTQVFAIDSTGKLIDQFVTAGIALGATNETALTGFGSTSIVGALNELKNTNKEISHNDYQSWADVYLAKNEGTITNPNETPNGLFFDVFSDSTKVDSVNSTSSATTRVGDNSYRVGLTGGQTYNTATNDNDAHAYLGANTVTDIYYYDRTRDSSPAVQVELGIDPNWYNGVTLSVATSSAQYSQNGVLSQKNPNLTTSYNGSLVKVTGNYASNAKPIFLTIKTPTTFDWSDYNGNAATGVTMTTGVAQSLGGTGVSVTFTQTDYNVGDVFKIASWYVEPSSATRGTKAQFPERSNIVASASSVDIIDADTQKLWMRFTQGTGQELSADSTFDPSGATMLNGKLYVSIGGSAGNGIADIDFVRDADGKVNTAGSVFANAMGISLRNSNLTYALDANNTYNLVSNISNDVTTAVIPNKPTQEITVGGWGAILYTASQSISEPVNLPYDFNQVPRITISYIGTASSAPSKKEDCSTTNSNTGMTATLNTNNSFQANVNATNGGVFTAGNYGCYSWTATGTVSPKQFIAIAGGNSTSGGTDILNETDGTVAHIMSSAGVATSQIWQTKVAIAGNTLYMANNNSGSNAGNLRLYYGIHGLSTEPAAGNYSRGAYGVGVLQSGTNGAYYPIIRAASASGTNQVTSLTATEGTSTVDGKSNTIYVGTNFGTTVIQENQGLGTNTGGNIDGLEENSSSAKWYTTNYISEEAIGDIRGMWPMDLDGSKVATYSGTVAKGAFVGDITASSANLQVAGAAVTLSSGVRNKGLTFNGTSNYISCSDASCGGSTKLDITSGTAISVGAWVMPTSSAGTQMIMSKWATNSGFYLRQGASMAVEWVIGQGSTINLTSNGVMKLNQWNHIVAVRDGANMYIYINGVLAGSGTSGTTTAIADNTNEFSIGAWANAGSNTQFFTGSIDEPFVTATAITAAEVKNMYQVGSRALQSHSTSLGLSAADSQQRLGGTTNTMGAAMPDFNRQYMYVGSNDATGPGALSQIQLNSDTNVKTFDVSATGNTPTGGTNIVDDDIDALGVGYQLELVGSAASGAKSMAPDNNANNLVGSLYSKTQTLDSATKFAYLWDSFVIDSSDASDFINVYACNSQTTKALCDSNNAWVLGTIIQTDSTQNTPEREYSFAFPTAGANMTFKFDFKRGSTKTNTYITRYGATWASSVGGADIAERYHSNEPVYPGDILTIDTPPASGDAGVALSRSSYDPKLIGIVTTNPGIVMDNNLVDLNFNAASRNSPNRPAVALAGRVPVKVSSKNGNILVGDPITSSDIAGVGIKATKAGNIIGKALEAFTCSDSQAPCEGKILVLVNVSWFDPDVYLTSTGDLQIVGQNEASPSGIASTNFAYKIVRITTDGLQEVVDRIGTFGQLVAGSIKAGAIESQDFVTQNLVAKVIRTDVISPIGDSTDVIVRIGTDATPSGKFAIQNSQKEEVASIDNLGNASFAGVVRSQNIDEIQNLLTQIQADQGLLSQVQDTATASAVQTINNLASLTVNDVYFTNQITGLDFSISGNAINSLSTPLKIQSLGMAPVELMAGLVKIDTKGNVNITGDLNVAGKFTTPTAEIKDITVDNFIVANPVEASPEGVVNPSIITTNATAGKAFIPAGATEITIKNSKVTDYTLVYVTPTSDTKNNVLYIKSKENGDFVVGFTNPIEIDADFNWWIVQIKQ